MSKYGPERTPYLDIFHAVNDIQSIFYYQITGPLEERKCAAQNEKNKGNEAFYCRDFKEALVYYNRSLAIHKNPSVYNNRAITYIKLEKYEEALKDSNIVIKEEPENIKGKSIFSW